MSLIKEYIEKTKHYKEQYGENTVVFMQVGAFFEVYGLQNKENNTIIGSNILDFSRICDLNIADKKTCIGADGVIMAGFSHYMLDKYLRRMQAEGYTIVVYTQDEQAKNTTRSLAGIYSPGTYFSLDTDNKISNNSICIWVEVVDFPYFNNKTKENIKTIYVGVSNIDIYTGKTCIYEFNEPYINNPTTFDNLERFISIYNPSEVILIGNISDKEMDNIIQYSNILTNSIHRISLLSTVENENIKRAINCQKQNYQLMILQKYFNTDKFELFYEYGVASQSFCFLMEFIYIHNPNLINKVFFPELENCSSRLTLANHSLKQLNIIEDHSYKGRLASVEKFLNVCSTPMGKRMFSYNLLNPITDVDKLNAEYDIIEYLLKHTDILDYILSKIQTIKDLSKICRLIMIKRATPSNIYQLYKNLNEIVDINKHLLRDNTISNYIHCKNGNSNITDLCSQITTIIHSKINLDISKDIDTCSSFDDNFFNRNVFDTLDNKTKLYYESMDILEAIKNYFNNIVGKYEKKGSSNDFFKIYTTEKNNIKLIGTKRRCVLLKNTLANNNSGTCLLDYVSSYNNEIKQITLNVSPLDYTFCSQTAQNDSIHNNTIDELIQNITSIKIELKEELTNCYIEFLNLLEKYQSILLPIIDYITILDLVSAKSIIAKKYKYCKPSIDNNDNNEHSYVHAKGLRHCLIEQLQQNELYVTNDISLGKEQQGILLYGTNAVGKTSLIRALGVSVILAQAGLYVPCSEFIYYPYQHIFTRILGNDNLFKGLSTFAVEMSELRTILRMSDSNSLILGDELCSGTESISAFSIFVAGILQLYKKKCSFIFATHLHEVVDYIEINTLEKLSFKHMTVFFDKKQNKLVYDRKLKDGPGDSMYGLEVCKSLSLPNDFLELAHNIRNKYHPISQSVLDMKSSHYNAKKIMGLCEICKISVGTEVHHIHQQKDADNDGYIKTDNHIFHKNHIANLMTICEKCHTQIHHTG